ncbi:MAG: YraN family protein [Candidatus Omnitrophica bacterium]|nr:YraN family protein [Candidatus Omnitrophota bacterium]MCM8807580.1 YraN family protein [Candidatus Omnitrophota bacterium]
MRNIELGKIGEEKAINFLQKNGYKIIDRNFRTKFGEIDIIAKKNRKIVFIEVKTRSSDNFGLPEEAVNKKKLRKIERVGLCYMNLKKINLPFTFEILSIRIDKNDFKFEIIPIF